MADNQEEQPPDNQNSEGLEDEVDELPFEAPMALNPAQVGEVLLELLRRFQAAERAAH